MKESTALPKAVRNTRPRDGPSRFLNTSVFHRTMRPQSRHHEARSSHDGSSQRLGLCRRVVDRCLVIEHPSLKKVSRSRDGFILRRSLPGITHGRRRDIMGNPLDLRDLRRRAPSNLAPNPVSNATFRLRKFRGISPQSHPSSAPNRGRSTPCDCKRRAHRERSSLARSIVRPSHSGKWIPMVHEPRSCRADHASLKLNACLSRDAAMEKRPRPSRPIRTRA